MNGLYISIIKFYFILKFYLFYFIENDSDSNTSELINVETEKLLRSIVI